MGAWDDLVGFGTALGNGVISVGKDMYFGAERTAEGLGMRGYDRTAAIGMENEYLVANLRSLVKGIVTAQDNPLFQLVSRILEKYYQWFPDDALEKVCKAASISTGYVAGRMVIGRQLALAIGLRIVSQIAATEAYQELAKKIGVSAAAGSTGVGTLLTLVMVQGVAQRASRASQRLRDRIPALWQELRSQRGLDVMYFLVEGPMSNYIDAIALAYRDLPTFQAEVRKLYQ